MMLVLKYNSLCHEGTNQNMHETNKNSATIVEPASREDPFCSNVLTVACLCNISISSEIKILLKVSFNLQKCAFKKCR